MASKRAQKRKACYRKEPLSKAEAFRLAVKLRNKQAPGRRAVDAYPCPFDGGHWHVGHRPGHTQQAINSKRREAGRLT